MPQTGGKPVKKSSKTKSKSSSTSKRHFTVVIGTKEHGLYCSSSPSSAARKAVSKLCGKKVKNVEFCLREITQGSKKKTYGPYLGHIEILAKPIQLKGRLVERTPVVRLKAKISAKKGGFPIGNNNIPIMSMNNFELTYDNFKMKVQRLRKKIAYQEQSGYSSNDTEKELNEFYKNYPYYLTKMRNENIQAVVLANQQRELRLLQLQQQQQQQRNTRNITGPIPMSGRTQLEYSLQSGEIIDPRRQFGTRNYKGRLIDPNTGKPFPPE